MDNTVNNIKTDNSAHEVRYVLMPDGLRVTYDEYLEWRRSEQN